MNNSIGVGIIVALTFTSTVLILKSEYYTKSQKIVLGILFMFPPGQWVLAVILGVWNKYNNVTIGFSADKTNKQIKELSYLNHKNILSNEEYETKLNKILEKEQEESFKKSNDYKTLEKLKNNGILTEQEFKDKSELLRRKIIKLNKNPKIDNENIKSQYHNESEKQDEFLGSGLYWIIMVVVIILAISLIVM